MLDPGDRIAIHELLGRYGHLIDARDWPAFAELFTPDAVLDYTAVRAPSICRGIEEIVAYFEPANHPSAHHVTNIVVTADGADRALVHSKFIAPFAGPTHTPKRLYGGDYHDVVVRAADGWRFAEKRCVGRWTHLFLDP